ncbi:MAG: elongation factor 1-beta [Methanomassiliicoccales archaeon]|jgi:translation elongation factor aEF-1 beta|nr:elongation factor 1-beta [Methanomassiliicoccales archaeon]
MGKVAAVYNLMPDDISIPMEEIARKIAGVVPEGVEVAKIEVKPVAFGLKMLTATFVMADAEGIVDKLETALHAIKGIQSVEAISLTLI